MNQVSYLCFEPTGRRLYSFKDISFNKGNFSLNKILFQGLASEKIDDLHLQSEIEDWVVKRSCPSLTRSTDKRSTTLL